MTSTNQSEVKPKELSNPNKNKDTSLFIKKFGVIKKVALKLSVILKSYIAENGFEMESITDDLEDTANSELVDILAEELNWATIEQKEKLVSTLKIYYGIESECVSDLLNFNWECTPNEQQAIRDYMEIQCPNLIKDGENEAMITVMAVGKKNEMPSLLTSLYDVFTKCRSTHKHRNKEHIKIDQFVEDNVLCKKLHRNTRAIIAQALKSYEFRLLPGFKEKSPQIFVDSCEEFIKNTIFVAKAIRNVFKSENFVAECLPFQVDLIIIPRKIVKEKKDIFDIHDDDDSESDDDEDDDENKDEMKDIGGGKKGAAELGNIFESVLHKKYNRECIKKEMKYAVDDNTWRDLTDDIRNLIKGKRCQRISIVIDRRFEPCVMYVYTLPDGKNEFPVNYCLTTLVYMSSRFVIPVWNETIDNAGTFPFKGGGFAPGKFFQVSYQVLSEEKTRLQWMFCGNGIRLTPEVMINDWPEVFVKNTLPKLYTVEYIEKEFGLNDRWFDSWANQFDTE